MSATCQTTMAAISTGLPSASLTLRTLVSKLLTRTETPRLEVNGMTIVRPVRRAVPTYRPKNWITLVWPGWMMTTALATIAASRMTTAPPTKLPIGGRPVALAEIAPLMISQMPPANRSSDRASARKPSTANAGRSLTSTRVPWWPTGRADGGAVCGSMVWSCGCCVLMASPWLVVV